MTSDEFWEDAVWFELMATDSGPAEWNRGVFGTTGPVKMFLNVCPSCGAMVDTARKDDHWRTHAASEVQVR